MNLKINYDNLAVQLLPDHKRRPNRVRVLRRLLSPLKDMFAAFDRWRREIRIHLNTTSQVISLSGYLTAKYGRGGQIVVETADRNGLFIGLIAEGVGHSLLLSNEGGTVGSLAGAFPTRQYAEENYGSVDFIVNIPDQAVEPKVRYEIERYRLASMSYKINVDPN